MARLLVLALSLLLIATKSMAYSDEDLSYIASQLDIPKEDLQQEAAKSSPEQEEQLQADFEMPDKLVVHGDAAIAAWTRYGAWVLRRKGFDNEARDLEWEYSRWFDAYLQRITGERMTICILTHH
jgi:hypothetical protein